MKIKTLITNLINNITDKKEAQSISSFMTFARTNKSRNELCHLAFTDKLTNVYNRNMLEAFREKFDTIELFVTIIDIDNLKQVNDTKGHHEGDKVIKAVASRIKEHSNWVFRLGGDEFLSIGTIPRFMNIPGASFGTVFKPSNVSLHEVMRTADFLMYKNKKKRSIPHEQRITK